MNYKAAQKRILLDMLQRRMDEFTDGQHVYKAHINGDGELMIALYGSGNPNPAMFTIKVARKT